MIVAQPSSSTRSPRPFPNSASSQRPLRLRVIRSIAPLSCAKTQKCPPVSPLPVTLTHSLSRNPFICHSYANTRGVGITVPKFFASGLQLSTVDYKLPSALTSFRINTCISVASKRLYPPLESTLTKNRGEGEGRVWSIPLINSSAENCTALGAPTQKW